MGICRVPFMSRSASGLVGMIWKKRKESNDDDVVTMENGLKPSFRRTPPYIVEDTLVQVADDSTSYFVNIKKRA